MYTADTRAKILSNLNAMTYPEQDFILMMNLLLIKVYRFTPYKLDPVSGKLIEPFMELYSILGNVGEDKDIGISIVDYQDGLFLLLFDVTPTSSANMEYLAKKEGGNCRLELHFRKPLPENITIIIYAIFPSELFIDAARNCTVNNLQRNVSKRSQ